MPLFLNTKSIMSLPTAAYSVATQLGFFAKAGLTVVYTQVPNSTAAFDSILSGHYDILTANVDNALNYRFNQGKLITVLGQLDQGPDLVVASTPNISSFEQLRGKPIIVDSPVSGYAFLLREVLADNGLSLGSDYYFMVFSTFSIILQSMSNQCDRPSAALLIAIAH